MISPLTLAATTTFAKPLEMDSATCRALVPSGYSLTDPSGRVTLTDIRDGNPTGTGRESQDGDGTRPQRGGYVVRNESIGLFNRRRPVWFIESGPDWSRARGQSSPGEPRSDIARALASAI